MNVEKRSGLGREVVSVVTALGIMSWVCSDFYGGMIFYLMVYGVFVAPVVLMYIFSVVDFLHEVLRKSKNVSEVKKFAHLSVVCSVALLIINNTGWLKSNEVMTATLHDDLFHFKLIFRENGSVENQIEGFLGYKDTFHGRYEIKNDTIIFSEVPYDNDFIPDTLLIDESQDAIFFHRNDRGQFSRQKLWLNYFEIHCD